MGKFFSSLRSRLILLVILASIPNLFFTLQSSFSQREDAKTYAEMDVVYFSQIASSMQANLVENVQRVLITVGHFPTFQNNDAAGCQEILTQMVDEHFKYYASFYVADLEGKILCSPPGMHTPPDFHTCEHYNNLVQATDFVISGYHICEHSGKSVLSIGYPILDENNQPMLVLNVSLDLTWLYDFAEQSYSYEGYEGVELIVLDEDGVILTHYPDNDLWRGYTVPQSSALYTLLKEGNGTTIGNNLEGKESIFAITPLEGTARKIYVALGMPTETAYYYANQTLVRNLIIQIIVIALVIGLMWLLGDSLIVRQAQVLVQATQKLAKGDLNVRTGLDYSRGELGQLSQAFDSMAEDLAAREAEREKNIIALNEYAHSLEHSNQELRDFTNIASHDLQEPLRKIQTFGELLQTRYQSSLDERGNDYIQRMRDAANRMQNLISELLSFSKVTFKTDVFKSVNLEEIVKQVIKDLDWQIEAKKAKITLSPLPTLEADPLQINQLIQNLVANALKFHQPGKPPLIRIYCNNKDNRPDQNNMFEIRIEDEGIGFDEKYLDRIFQPFQRLHPHNGIEGTGMGLAICRKIVDHHGGKITAKSKPNQGTIFIIRLPKEQIKPKTGETDYES